MKVEEWKLASEKCISRSLFLCQALFEELSCVCGWVDCGYPGPEGVTLIKTFNEKEKELQALGWIELAINQSYNS